MVRYVLAAVLARGADAGAVVALILAALVVAGALLSTVEARVRLAAGGVFAILA